MGGVRIKIPAQVEASGVADVQLYIRYFRAGYTWTRNSPLRRLDRNDVEGRRRLLEAELTTRDFWPAAYDAGVAQAVEEGLWRTHR